MHWFRRVITYIHILEFQPLFAQQPSQRQVFQLCSPPFHQRTLFLHQKHVRERKDIWCGGGSLHFTMQFIIKIFSQDNSIFLEICKIDTHKHNKTSRGSKQYWIMWEMHIGLKVKNYTQFYFENIWRKTWFQIYFLFFIT